MRRNSMYRIKDNYFDFWFRFINPNTSEIEKGDFEAVIEFIRRGLNEYVSRVFEDVCREAVSMGSMDGMRFSKVGSFWEKGEEIDIVALNEGTKDLLLGECKWGDKKLDKAILTNLERKAELVRWHKSKRKDNFAVFSKAGFTDACKRYASESGIHLYDLKDITRIFDGIRDS